MSIVDLDKVDLISVRAGSPVVKLVITDHLEWDDFEGHARLFQDKVNAYLGFVEAGELAKVRTPEIPASPEIRIALVLACEPPPAAYDLFARARAFLAAQHIGFDVEVRGA